MSGIMATGTVPSSMAGMTGLRTVDRSLGFVKSVDFTRIAYAPEQQRMKPRRRIASVIRNSSKSGSDIVELEPASEGSPLLGTNLSF